MINPGQSIIMIVDQRSLLVKLADQIINILMESTIDHDCTTLEATTKCHVSSNGLIWAWSELGLKWPK